MLQRQIANPEKGFLPVDMPAPLITMMLWPTQVPTRAKSKQSVWGKLSAVLLQQNIKASSTEYGSLFPFPLNSWPGKKTTQTDNYHPKDNYLQKTTTQLTPTPPQQTNKKEHRRKLHQKTNCTIGAFIVWSLWLAQQLWFTEWCCSGWSENKSAVIALCSSHKACSWPHCKPKTAYAASWCTNTWHYLKWPRAFWGCQKVEAYAIQQIKTNNAFSKECADSTEAVP